MFVCMCVHRISKNNSVRIFKCDFGKVKEQVTVEGI